MKTEISKSLIESAILRNIAWGNSSKGLSAKTVKEVNSEKDILSPKAKEEILKVYNLNPEKFFKKTNEILEKYNSYVEQNNLNKDLSSLKKILHNSLEIPDNGNLELFNFRIPSGKITEELKNQDANKSKFSFRVGK